MPSSTDKRGHAGMAATIHREIKLGRARRPLQPDEIAKAMELDRLERQGFGHYRDGESTLERRRWSDA